MLFGETVAVYCENHTEHTNTLCGQNAVYGNSRCLLLYTVWGRILSFVMLKQVAHIVSTSLEMVK
jgi:hypothetical protein